MKAASRLWVPQQALFSSDALLHAHGKDILRRVQALGVPTQVLPGNRLSGVPRTYKDAKKTLAVVAASPSVRRLQPIPPSADWQFHLAQGCPAHCQYCYLAGSLSGPPIVRVYGNLDEILGELPAAMRPASGRNAEGGTSFEASCYTDPLGIEHLTGSLSRCIEFFAGQPHGRLRWVSKFTAVEPLLSLTHGGHTRCRVSLNAPWVTRHFEGGTPAVAARLAAFRQLGSAGYPLGCVIAPILPFDGWAQEYAELLDAVAVELGSFPDLTFELITHRFTPGSKSVLQDWYPASKLDLDETGRAEKRNKFGGKKFVFAAAQMSELRAFFQREIARRFPRGRILYWT
jgi:spore photoproduct lyase